MLISDRIAAGRLWRLKWGIVLAALVANPQPRAQGQPLQAGVTYIGSDVCEAWHEDIYKAFLKSPHYQVDTEKHGRWKGLRSLPRSRLQACRNAVADRHCEPVEGLAKARRRGLPEMSLQSAHTNWADPRLAREKLSPVYGVPFGAQGIQPSLPVEEPGSESDVRGLP